MKTIITVMSDVWLNVWLNVDVTQFYMEFTVETFLCMKAVIVMFWSVCCPCSCRWSGWRGCESNYSMVWKLPGQTHKSETLRESAVVCLLLVGLNATWYDIAIHMTDVITDAITVLYLEIVFSVYLLTEIFIIPGTFPGYTSFTTYIALLWELIHSSRGKS